MSTEDMPLSVAVNRASKARKMIDHYLQTEVIQADPVTARYRAAEWGLALREALEVMREHGMEDA